MPALSLAPAGGPLALVVVATPRGSIAMPIAASSIPQGTVLLAPSVQARKEASRAFAVSPIGIAERFDEHGFFLRGALHHRHGDCADACRNNQPVRGAQSETGKHRHPEAIHRVSDPGIRPLHDELVTSPNT